MGVEESFAFEIIIIIIIQIQMAIEIKSGFESGPELIIENINQAFIRVILIGILHINNFNRKKSMMILMKSRKNSKKIKYSFLNNFSY